MTDLERAQAAHQSVTEKVNSVTDWTPSPSLLEGPPVSIDNGEVTFCWVWENGNEYKYAAFKLHINALDDPINWIELAAERLLKQL